jgi:hypothetical protein
MESISNITLHDLLDEKLEIPDDAFARWYVGEDPPSTTNGYYSLNTEVQVLNNKLLFPINEEIEQSIKNLDVHDIPAGSFSLHSSTPPASKRTRVRE